MFKAKLPVFIIDEDVSVRMVLKHLLQAEGFDVELFSSTQTFLDSVPADTNGVLIIDFCTAGINGFELQKKLNERRSGLKTIFITAFSEPGDEEAAMAQGAAAFLRKPVDTELLFNSIQMASSTAQQKRIV